MNPRKRLNKIRTRRTARTRAKIFGTAKKPRLAVSRSNRYIYAQLINDEAGRTVVHGSGQEVKGKKPKTEVAALVGELIGKRAVEKGVTSAVFDRRAYKYHGRIKALAEGARKAGLKL
ncbi:MAG: 50S ribosomal protein L18 [Candidatus Liptonbacteria bacterium]|nr:50S ribosomal protein L18 [Candidatus Liptonbacteria bacterium]